MKKFLLHVGKFLMDYPQISLNTAIRTGVERKVLEFLNLENLGKLRDRFEGQAFLDKSMRNIGGLIAVQKYLEGPVRSMDNLDLAKFQPQIVIRGKTFYINVFEYGNLPVLASDLDCDYVIFVIQRSNQLYTICGFLDKTTVLKKVEKIGNTVTTGNDVFANFELLEKPEKLISQD